MRRLDIGEQAQALAESLDRFVREARVRLALLLNKAGQVIAQRGFTRAVDVMGAAALAAGIHSSSGELARMMGERGFAHLHHRGADRQIFLGRFDTPAEELLLLAVFDGDSSLGLVRVFFEEFATQVAQLPGWKASAPPRDEAFERDLMQSLDRLFGPDSG
ncbi:MAG: roadblock/LC7 domain-containing protein [Gemmatimonadetes bacterium]|nr:roadblock/LC7 domain-containing protein [Gemmatimonadota bacterium]